MKQLQLNEKIFREYDIRGTADTDLSPEVVQRLSLAIGTFYRSRNIKNVSIGRDCRISSPRISDALVEGLRATGINVVFIGIVPTPLLYFSVPELKMDGGVMITGSHNPSDQNGFKICAGPSTIHGGEIQEIKRILLKEDYATTGQRGSLIEKEIKSRYTEMVEKNISSPLNLKVVVDSGNGMGGCVAPELYRRLGCEVIELHSELDGRFPNHHPDPTQVENLEDLVSAVTSSGAVVGIGFDGDADRIGAVDRTGRVIFGDELLILYARSILNKYPQAKIISEVKASYRLYNDIEQHGGIPIMWKTGHSLIKAKMKEENAVLAGEMSGHMFFNDRYYGFDDAIYAGARLLEIISQTKQSPSELLKDLPPSFSTPEIRVDCPDEQKFSVVEEAKLRFKEKGLKVNGIDGARVEFGDGWGLVRASNTQPVLVYRFEASTSARLSEIRKTVETVVSEIMG